MMGEIKLFKTSKQLNQLLCKMIHCFEVFETPHAGDPYWSEQCKCNKNLLQKNKINNWYLNKISFSQHILQKNVQRLTFALL